MGPNRRAAVIFLHGNLNFKAHFQIFFACGALNLLHYQTCEPTPYTTILRKQKSTDQNDFTLLRSTNSA